MPKKPPPPPPAPRGRTVIELDAANRSKTALMRGFEIYLRNPGWGVRDVWRNGRLSSDEDAEYLCEVVPLSTFSREAGPSHGDWRARREAFWAEVEAGVATKLRDEVIRDEADEVKSLTALRNRVFDWLMGEGEDADGEPLPLPKPKSYEGLLSAFRQLDGHVVDRRDRVVDRLARHVPAPPPGASAPGSPGGTPTSGAPTPDQLTDDDISELARMLTRKRAGLIEEPAEPPAAEEPEPDAP